MTAVTSQTSQKAPQKTPPRKIVLAYSGGLDTSVMLKWLTRRYDCEVVAYVADVGQGLGELDGLEKKARATGASAFHALDLREAFVKEYVWLAVKAAAVYEGTYLLGTSLARPIIAKGHIEVARAVGADAVAHGATGKGNDQVRFELTYAALAPDLQVIAAWRSWELKSRTDLIDYCAQEKIPVAATAAKPYSIDRNLMHTSFEGGILEDPWAEPPASMFTMTKNVEDTPAAATTVTLDFERGEPVGLNGTRMGAVELLTALNQLGGENGIGRVDLVENRFVGMKSRGVYETPGVTILHAGMRAVESLTLDREVLALRNKLSLDVAKLIYCGFWHSPEFAVLRSTVEQIAADVTGTVRLKLHKGQCTVLGRRAPKSLYQPALATFEADTVYDQADAGGFIRLNALRLRTYHGSQGETGSASASAGATPAKKGGKE
jgi:argininosuccinate synthase